MKKISFLIIVCCSMGISILPKPGYAIMTALTDTGMKEITGQAGFAITAADRIDLSFDAKTVSYFDDNGTDGSGAYLSANDMVLDGYVKFKEPVSINVTTEEDPFTNRITTGVNIKMTEVEINVDRFEVGSITVGSEPGSGPSFGSFSITGGLRALISGNVRITAH